MLVKIKEQKILSSDILNQDNEIKSFYIDRQGIRQTFTIIENESVVLSLYVFDTIDNVETSIVSTSKVERIEVDSVSGNYVVTSEDGMTKTYGYTIEVADYSLGLPIIDSIADVDGESLTISTALESKIINGQIFNVGVIAKKSNSGIDINNVSVFGGSAILLEDSTDYQTIERNSLYNGVDTYLKVFKTADETSTEFENFAYYLVVENSELFPTIVNTPSVKIEYANQIGYLNFDVFVPIVSGLDIGEIYNKETKAELVTYLTNEDVSYFENVLFDSVDYTYITNSITDLNWNENFDKGFVKDDVLNMSLTWAVKQREIISRDFKIIWDEYIANNTFDTTEQLIQVNQQLRLKWLRENGIEATFEWLDYLVNGEDGVIDDAIEGTSKTEYVRDLKLQFINEFTFANLLSNLTENDINFFLNRFEYMLSIYDSYVSNLSKSDLVAIINVYQTLKEANRLRVISGQASASYTLNVDISTLVNKSELMYLRNPFT